MERKKYGTGHVRTSPGGRYTNAYIRQRTKITDTTELMARLKLKWLGYNKRRFPRFIPVMLPIAHAFKNVYGESNEINLYAIIVSIRFKAYLV